MNIDRWLLYQWIRNISNNKIIIFGSDERAEKLYHKLCLMDLNIEYFVDDMIEELTLCGCEVRNYYELLYEDLDNIGLVIFEPEILKKLFDVGVCTRWNVHNCLLMFNYDPLNGLYPMDPSIGYNIFGDVEYPGFVLFGDRNAEYTIVTLGGSTTDVLHSKYHSNQEIKSWSEILSDKLNEKMTVRVLCGGVAGYKSSQELVKLIRDVIPLQPDMVVTYDGFNDIVHSWKYHEKGFPFLHHYQKELFTAISQIGKEEVVKGDCTFGINSKWNSYINWKNSIKMMQLICEGYGIKFVSVLQPSFYNQIGNFGGENDLELWMHARMSDEYQALFEQFFHERDVDEWQPEWLKDFRNIFQGMDGIFYDRIHVREKGNAIIAEKMLEIVREIG